MQHPLVFDKIHLQLAMDGSILQLMMFINILHSLLGYGLVWSSRNPNIVVVRVLRKFPFILDNHIMHKYARCHNVPNLFMIPTRCRASNNSPPRLKDTKSALNIFTNFFLLLNKVCCLHIQGMGNDRHKSQPIGVYTISKIITHVIRVTINGE